MTHALSSSVMRGGRPERGEILECGCDIPGECLVNASFYEGTIGIFFPCNPRDIFSLSIGQEDSGTLHLGIGFGSGVCDIF